MHELSIAENIVEAVQREMTTRGINRVSTIALRIGRMTDVEPESLKFGFEVITADSPLNGTVLVIEHLPVVARCSACGAEFEVPDMMFTCPSCRSPKVDMIQGMELDIAYIEIPNESTGSKSDM